MLERRTFLATGLALITVGPALAAPVAPPGGKIAFAVMRKGKKIGEHTVTFSTDGGVLVARADAQMTVGLGPITVFNYRHSQVERWKDGRFESMETSTTQNGQKIHMIARRTDAGVTIEGGQGAKPLLAASALPLSHWNRASLNGPLFNPQDGKLMRLSAARPVPAPIELANGKQVSATRIALTGETTIDDWYDGDQAWTALRAKAKDGSIVEYRKL